MEHGWEEHLGDVALADLIEFNKGLLPNTLTYLICPSITKMAALSVLYRINPSKIYRGIVVSIATSILIYTLVLCIITGGPCNPLKTGTTVCLENVALSQAVLNIVSDFAVIAVPIPTIYSLHLSLNQKISLGCLMAVGSSVVICSIARLPYVVVLAHAEVNLGIICTYAMRLKPLAVKYFPQLGFFSRGTAGGGKASHPSGRDDGHGHGHGPRSYQLHSYQKGSVDPVLSSQDVGSYRSYRVDVEGKGAQGDWGSNDKILA